MLPVSDVQRQPRIRQPRQTLDQFLVIVAEYPRIADDDLADAVGLGVGAEPDKISELLFVSWRCVHGSVPLVAFSRLIIGRITVLFGFRAKETRRNNFSSLASSPIYSSVAAVIVGGTGRNRIPRGFL